MSHLRTTLFDLRAIPNPDPATIAAIARITAAVFYEKKQIQWGCEEASKKEETNAQS